METLQQYLQNRHSPATAASYYRAIVIYLSEEPGARDYHFNAVVDYINGLHRQYNKANSVKAILNAVKRYYDWLCESGQRATHPCREININIRFTRDCQLQDLLSEKQLTQMPPFRVRRNQDLLNIRNKVLMSLLIHQGLTKQEILRLNTEDIHLADGLLKIASGSQTNGRQLPLEGSQIMLLHHYLSEVRSKLLSKKSQPTPCTRLLISDRGNAFNEYSFKPLFSDLSRQLGRPVCIRLIRQSLMAIKLNKGEDIRRVQLFFGHKNASSTQRYKGADIDLLREGVNRYHPLS